MKETSVYLKNEIDRWEFRKKNSKKEISDQ